jgi:hypothetical protein
MLFVVVETVNELVVIYLGFITVHENTTDGLGYSASVLPCLDR